MLTLTTIGRIIAENDIVLARKICSRFELARSHIVFGPNGLALKDAGAFDKSFAWHRKSHLERQIAESSNSTDEAKTDNKLNRTNRLGNLFRKIKLWMPTHRIRHLAGIITHDEHGNQTILSGNKT